MKSVRNEVALKNTFVVASQKNLMIMYNNVRQRRVLFHFCYRHWRRRNNLHTLHGRFIEATDTNPTFSFGNR